jgi:hypothetical protein
MQSLSAATGSKHRAIERFTAEVDFAWRMADSQNKQDEWQPLIAEAVSLVVEGLGGGGDAEALVAKAEAHLAPLAKAAREYVIYCAGHAHIDMNWMWTWPETVSVTYDTFSTMDKLMDEFPEFHFTQSQASVYHLTRQYAPDLFERIKKRVAEGRWDVTASQWVEGDKNMASGEILARHLLYTRRWLKDTSACRMRRARSTGNPIRSVTAGPCRASSSAGASAGTTTTGRTAPGWRAWRAGRCRSFSGGRARTARGCWRMMTRRTATTARSPRG